MSVVEKVGKFVKPEIIMADHDLDYLDVFMKFDKPLPACCSEGCVVRYHEKCEHGHVNIARKLAVKESDHLTL